MEEKFTDDIDVIVNRFSFPSWSQRGWSLFQLARGKRQGARWTGLSQRDTYGQFKMINSE